MKLFSDKVIEFNTDLNFPGRLPSGINIMNPFRENGHAMQSSLSFYQKFYNDQNRRYLILGINPGRFGSAVTGVPFTDSKRLKAECGIQYGGRETHEPSSVFVYEMIRKYGGVKAFYKNFYINSVCPLGFTATSDKGREINYNYYDNKYLTEAVYDFIVKNIQKHISFGVHTNTCFCLGKGKNERFLKLLNEKYKFFENIVALEHPRFIMQYRAKTKEFYINKYIKAFREFKI